MLFLLEKNKLWRKTSAHVVAIRVGCFGALGGAIPTEPPHSVRHQGLAIEPQRVETACRDQYLLWCGLLLSRDIVVGLPVLIGFYFSQRILAVSSLPPLSSVFRRALSFFFTQFVFLSLPVLLCLRCTHRPAPSLRGRPRQIAWNRLQSRNLPKHDFSTVSDYDSACSTLAPPPKQ